MKQNASYFRRDQYNASRKWRNDAYKVRLKKCIRVIGSNVFVFAFFGGKSQGMNSNICQLWCIRRWIRLIYSCIRIKCSWRQNHKEIIDCKICQLWCVRRWIKPIHFSIRILYSLSTTSMQFPSIVYMDTSPIS